ncbi:hypothetical protein HPP92_023412 [Vanilla planifolia]|uniref:Uncharacterized protein n=1 Tax=Vanilla planifolia TaxID=51239 RepID=A0A835UER3_VANPL|nr:hypothetical protein HPP92_023412 [Vanilla planifolia]
MQHWELRQLFRAAGSRQRDGDGDYVHQNAEWTADKDTGEEWNMQGSRVKISDVRFSGVRVTSATEMAIKLDCSPTNPCIQIALDNIMLT